jgi:hypothetical protein
MVILRVRFNNAWSDRLRSVAPQSRFLLVAQRRPRSLSAPLPAERAIPQTNKWRLNERAKYDTLAY